MLAIEDGSEVLFSFVRVTCRFRALKILRLRQCQSESDDWPFVLEGAAAGAGGCRTCVV